MSGALYVEDSGGTVRAAKVIYVEDASNVVRLVQLTYVQDASNVVRLVYSAFTPIATAYSAPGGGTITIPPYCFTMGLEVFGSTGIPGHGAGTGCLSSGGGGAGSGGYAHSTFSVGTSAGLTVIYSIGGVTYPSTISSGTFAITTLSAPAGGSGVDAPSIGRGGAGGAAGGNGTGGNVSVSVGNAGMAGDSGDPVGGAPGAGVVGVYGYSGQSGGHGGGGASNSGITDGQPGRVVVYFA
jgi:hypothetical protein